MGDDGVGKSSLMVSIMCNYFPQNVKAVLTDAMIPTACNANNTCITLMDSSAEPGERESLKQKILLADSIVLLFDVTRLDTLHNINEIWIPLILELQPGKPLSSLKPAIIVGTKIDLVTDSVEEELVRSIMERFPFIAAYMQCSALKLINIHEVITSGESIASCPIAPIYDVVRHEFTLGCRQAFQRIFRILDLDHDNLLNDFEISNSQLQCFNLEITQEDVNALKGKIGEQVPGGLYNNALTFEGFLGVMTAVSDLLIPWTILGHYGYTAQDDQLILHIPPELLTLPKLGKDQVYELSEDAKDFLLGLARNAYQENTRPINPDSDNQSELEDCLTSEALRWILSVLPSDVPNPWNNPPDYKVISLLLFRLQDQLKMFFQNRASGHIKMNTNSISNNQLC
jgi:Ras family protein T1